MSSFLLSSSPIELATRKYGILFLCTVFINLYFEFNRKKSSLSNNTNNNSNNNNNNYLINNNKNNKNTSSLTLVLYTASFLNVFFLIIKLRFVCYSNELTKLFYHLANFSNRKLTEKSVSEYLAKQFIFLTV